MNTPLKVTAFALGLAAVFGAALAVGAAVGPVGTAAADRTAHGTSDGMADGMSDGMAAGHDEAAGEHDAGHLPAGLAVTEDGYTLALDHDALAAGAATPLAFRI